jgi:GntR family transcriptional regulator, transcriptional repressor for pyruvate dehydrogenase complex
MLRNPPLELPSPPMTSRAPAQFATLKRVPAYLQVSERIRAAILGGQIPTGELLPTETELATQFGVTRSTVREAIRLLEQGGLLGRAGRKRLAVRLPSLESASRSISVAMQMHRVTFKDLWEISMGLEPLAARLACATLDAQYTALLAANLERTRAAFDDDLEMLEAEIEFHDLVARATRNHALLLAREPLNLLFYPAYRPVIERLKPGKRILESHQKIFEAIRRNDPDTAAEWAEKHMRDFRRGILMAKLDFDGPVAATYMEGTSRTA